MIILTVEQEHGDSNRTYILYGRMDTGPSTSQSPPPHHHHSGAPADPQALARTLSSMVQLIMTEDAMQACSAESVSKTGTSQRAPPTDTPTPSTTSTQDVQARSTSAERVSDSKTRTSQCPPPTDTSTPHVSITRTSSQWAPPTDTPTPSAVQLIKTEDMQACSAENGYKTGAPRYAPPTPLISQRNVRARPNVGLLRAQSPWLRKDGVCIAILEDKSVSQKNSF